MPDMVRNAGCAGMVRLSGYNPANNKCAVNSVINNLKRIRDRDNFNFFAAQLILPLRKMLEEFELDLCDTVITFCPRRRSAVRGHGFDQSEELARRIAERSGARFEILLERRPFNLSREQKHLDAAGRFENSRHAVRLTPEGYDAAGERIILIDDIVTTGATISAAADLLRSAGVQFVIAACLATAVRR
jgi:ComF family protein